MTTLTPDGYRYLSFAQTRRAASPFRLRPLLPFALGTNTRLWQIQQITAWLLLCGALAVYTETWWSPVLILGLSGVMFNLRYPVLVDLTGMALALTAAVFAQHGRWELAIAVVVVAGFTRETAPIFAALYAWHPLLLVGLVAPLISWCLPTRGPDVLDEENQWILDHPFRAGVKYHRDTHIWYLVLPWGAALAALSDPSVQLWTTLAVAYAQLVVATDTQRLYMWAFPVMVAAAIGPLTGAWLLPLLIVHLVNPYQGAGG